MGLPRLLGEDTVDTKPPRNPMDMDFDGSSITLPSPRSKNDPTLVSFIIASEFSVYYHRRQGGLAAANTL